MKKLNPKTKRNLKEAGILLFLAATATAWFFLLYALSYLIWPEGTMAA